MNDTILNPRQKRVLELINQSNGLSRLEILRKLPVDYKVSIPTLSRDLNYLSKKGLVRVRGGGRSTAYLSISLNPLLRFFDIDSYFAVDPDQRAGIKTSFNFGIFDNFTGLFSPDEIANMDQINKSFNHRDIYPREIERFVIELAWKSSKIEGNTYSLLDTETLIKQQVGAKGHPKEEAVMILNHKSAFETILLNRDEYKILSFSQVTQLHNTLIKDLNVSTGIRPQAVGITGTLYHPIDNQWQIREAMDKFVSAVNQARYPLEKALITVAMISYIQPFEDGNKRTGRMLANALLLANDFFPLSYRSVDETDYKKALVIFYEQNSLSYLKKIIVDQYRFALDTYFR